MTWQTGTGIGWVRRGLAFLFSLFWLLPGFGLIDLTVTWSPSWLEVLEAGWGVFFTFLVAVPFIAIGARPQPPVAAPLMLVVAAVALAASALFAAERGCWWMAVAIAVQTVIVAGRPPSIEAVGIRGLHRLDRLSAVDRGMGVLAAVGVVPWAVYAVHMWSLNRENHVESDITNGIDHLSVQGGLGLALALLPLLAAAVPATRVLVGLCAGTSAAYLGLVSLAWHPTPGSFGPVWSVLCMAWGVALATLPLLPAANSGKPQATTGVSA